MIVRQFVCCILAAFFLFGLCACGLEPSIIRYDVSQGADSLDPQFATGETEQLIIHNIFEGLVRQTPDGQVVPCAAQGYTVSEDGATYTFTLRPDMVWDDYTTQHPTNTPVTAQDFVFAFQRIFNQISPSPYAQQYLSIQNAPQVLEGSLPSSQLGVRALDERTVEFRLSYPDPLFLENLCHSSAMPCNQAMFQSYNGKYGSSVATTPSNGPFRLDSWDNSSRIYLKRNPYYYDLEGVGSPGVFLMLGRDVQTPSQQESGEAAPTRFQLVMDGKAEACQADYAQARQAAKAGLSHTETQSTVWALVYNQNNPAFGVREIRQAFTRAVNPQALEPVLPESLLLTQRLVPPSVTLFTQPYIQLSQVENPNRFHPQGAKEVFRAGLEQLGVETLTNVELLVPEDSALLEVSSLLQQAWQQQLAVSVNIVTVPREDLSSRLRLGDYKIALVPLEASSNSPQSVLQRFSTGAPGNLWGYASAAFDQQLLQAGQSHQQEGILSGYQAAEEMLLADAVALPLLVERSYFVVGENVSGLECYPYGGKVYFKGAVSLR